ncbi:hypothetical protein CEUSTIGMA_g5095.t1 [Chlamydomonas eustigma]|uniref:EamA domain-containing protein n=1 Tax=Chlamydomonas eustigma TaxID=1157962 RepID=A0A250X429_9CHLO|nr:hypothetical protein CEUSTIGMA_g5095.t1 [Chlamydomonas eustigma]|eukprot:GAX77652.1 hypothetical protein CEUSTIGMA_g5095.t1 [Chlamydomonas eustigma]
MNTIVLILALGMLLTGTINTVSTKFQDLAIVGYKPDGTPIRFKHFVIQSACMFFGESLCLVPYFILRWRKSMRRKAGLEPPSTLPKRPRTFFLRRALVFAIPALCDATGTTMLNIGLFYTNASTYQMLRGTLVLFAGGFTILLLRRKLFIHHWMGMILITAGAAIVGASSIIYSPAHSSHAPPPPSNVTLSSHSHHETLGSANTSWPSRHFNMDSIYSAFRDPVSTYQQFRTGLEATSGSSEGATAPLFGDVMVVVAQGFAALQFILEEKFLGSFRMQPLVAVGLEGMWGFMLCMLALPFMPAFKDSEGRPLDDLPGALREMYHDPVLRNAILISIASIGLFNFLGLSVTKALSGASRATIDACRTLFVWVVTMCFGWEAYRNLQVVGFLVLVSGTSLYNEILKSFLPQVYPSMDDYSKEEGRDSDEEQYDLEAPLLLPSELPDVEDSTSPLRLQSATNRYNALQKSSASSVAGRPVNIRGTSPSHKAQQHYTMARSMILGISTLSPRPLDDMAMTEELQESSQDVLREVFDVSSVPYSGPLSSTEDSEVQTVTHPAEVCEPPLKQEETRMEEAVASTSAPGSSTAKQSSSKVAKKGRGKKKK